MSAINFRPDRALPGPGFVLCAALRRRREADGLRIASVKRGLGSGTSSPRDDER